MMALVLKAAYFGLKWLTTNRTVYFGLMFIPFGIVVLVTWFFYLHSKNYDKKGRQEEIYDKLRALKELYGEIDIYTLDDIHKISKEIKRQILDDTESHQKRVSLVINLSVPTLILGVVGELVKLMVDIAAKHPSDPRVVVLLLQSSFIVLFVVLTIAIAVLASDIFKISYWNRTVIRYVSMYEHAQEKSWSLTQTAKYVANQLV